MRGSRPSGIRRASQSRHASYTRGPVTSRVTLLHFSNPYYITNYDQHFPSDRVMAGSATERQESYSSENSIDINYTS